MKVLVIGLFCIFWVQKASSAPKWSNLTTFRPPVDDLELTTDYDLMDTELDFGNGSCFDDDGTGQRMDNDVSRILELDNGNGFCYDDHGNETVMDFGLTDHGFPAYGPSSPQNVECLWRSWLKTANLIVAVVGLACLLRVLRAHRKQRVTEKRRKRLYKLMSKRKPDKPVRLEPLLTLFRPLPVETDETRDVAIQPDNCTGTKFTPIDSSRDSPHPEVPSVSGTDGFVASTSTVVPGIDPEFIRYIESFDWDTVLQPPTTPEDPAPQEQRMRDDGNDERGCDSHAQGDVFPTVHSDTEPPAMSANRSKIVVADIKMRHTTKESLVEEEVRKEDRDVIPSWKSDIRKYLANVPAGILDGWKAKWMERWIDGQTSLTKPNQNVPKGSGKEQNHRLPKKKVTFSEDVAVKQLFFGHSCPLVPKAMRKRVEIRMIGDILPLKGDGEGEPFKHIKRSNKMLSLLRF